MFVNSLLVPHIFHLIAKIEKVIYYLAYWLNTVRQQLIVFSPTIQL